MRRLALRPRPFRLTSLAALGLLLATSVSPALAANSSSGQLAVSFTGGVFSLSGGGSSPFGFWVWCQSTTTNSYGNDCAGSAYFYALNPATESVEGYVTGGSAGSGYTLQLWNTTGNLAISCSLTTSGPAMPGPRNTVTTGCSSPAGSGTVTNAVVSGSGT